MSAYVCEPSTINRIVAGLMYCTINGGHPKPYPTTKYGAPTIQVYNMDQAKGLGQLLYAMNVNAVDQRYGREEEFLGEYGYDPNIAYGYQPVDVVSPIQLLKTINNLLYQCTEGNIPDTVLYQDLTDFSHTLAHYILEHTQEYEDAEWG